MDKTQIRRDFLADCSDVTRRYQGPVVDINAVNRHPNPAGLGHAVEYSSQGSLGQSSVLFDTLGEYNVADETGHAPGGGTEYGIPGTPEVERLAAKIASKYADSAGAVIYPSGLSAITETVKAFAPLTILIPDSVYFPAFRDLNQLVKTGRLRVVRYPAGASREEFLEKLKPALEQCSPKKMMLYIEAPGSGTFEIPDLAAIVGIANRYGIRTVMDNTWASHVRFQPLSLGVDVTVQATTKYEGGYGDTPGGAVIARRPEDLELLRTSLRRSGNGAVSPQHCMRLFNRLDSTEERMDRHFDTARRLMDWFVEQPFVFDVLCPAYTNSPYHQRFQDYFGGKGNGLFTIVFKNGYDQKQVNDFIDSLLLFRVAESWGGHLSLALPVHPSHRDPATLPDGVMFRFHAGLEDPTDLISDLEQAARVFNRWGAKPLWGLDNRLVA